VFGASTGLSALQNGRKAYEGIVGFGNSLIVLEGLHGHLKEYLATMAKVFCHDFKERAGVDRKAILLPYCYGQACLGYCPDKYRCCSSMQANFCCDEGFLLRQASSFAKTE